MPCPATQRLIRALRSALRACYAVGDYESQLVCELQSKLMHLGARPVPIPQAVLQAMEQDCVLDPAVLRTPLTVRVLE
jgi:hypothetical protein